MQQRFRRGTISIGQAKCDGCNRLMQHGEMHLVIDEKPSEKFKEETVYMDEVDCTECGKKLANEEHYAIVLEGDSEKCLCHTCLKKKGGEAFVKKNLGVVLTFEKTKERSRILRYCAECCEKRKAGIEKKEKGDKIFTFFPAKTGR